MDQTRGRSEGGPLVRADHHTDFERGASWSTWTSEGVDAENRVLVRADQQAEDRERDR